MSKYDEAIAHILTELKNNLPSELTYHSYDHTVEVISLTTEISLHENVVEKELDILKVAAAFHDCGFLKGLHHHEINGCEIAQEVLPKLGFSQEECDQIKSMIMATRLPQSPQNLLEEIICDADLGYIGGESYFDVVAGLHSEIVATSHPLTKNAWLDMQISFLKAQSFFTDYAINTFESKKLEVLEILKDKRNS